MRIQVAYLEFQNLSKGRDIDLLAQVSFRNGSRTGCQLDLSDRLAKAGHTLRQPIALEWSGL